MYCSLTSSPLPSGGFEHCPHCTRGASTVEDAGCHPCDCPKAIALPGSWKAGLVIGGMQRLSPRYITKTILKVSHALGAAENLRRALFFGHVQNRRQPALHDTILNNVSPRVGDVAPKQPQNLTPLGADQRTGPRDQGGHATVDRRQHGCNKNCDQTCV